MLRGLFQDLGHAQVPWGLLQDLGHTQVPQELSRIWDTWQCQGNLPEKGLEEPQLPTAPWDPVDPAFSISLVCAPGSFPFSMGSGPGMTAEFGRRS